MTPVRILLVEDDRGDIRLTQEALVDSDIDHSLNVVRDGAEALDYLYQRGRFAQALPPNIILLDLNLPGKHGHEVLQQIKSDDALKHIPVIILSTSDNIIDVQASYRLYANSYVTKPEDFDGFKATIQVIENFWFDTAQLPG